jgi:hypothetical protein
MGWQGWAEDVLPAAGGRLLMEQIGKKGSKNVKYY